MAEALFIVSKTPAGGEHVVNDVRAVLINKDDGQTDAQIIADAVAQLNANAASATGIDPFPADYLDTVLNVSDLAAGALKDNKDMVIITSAGAPVVVQG